MAKCKALTESAVKGLNVWVGAIQNDRLATISNLRYNISTIA